MKKRALQLIPLVTLALALAGCNIGVAQGGARPEGRPTGAGKPPGIAGIGNTPAKGPA